MKILRATRQSVCRFCCSTSYLLSTHLLVRPEVRRHLSQHAVGSESPQAPLQEGLLGIFLPVQLHSRLVLRLELLRRQFFYTSLLGPWRGVAHFLVAQTPFLFLLLCSSYLPPQAFLSRRDRPTPHSLLAGPLLRRKKVSAESTSSQCPPLRGQGVGSRRCIGMT